MSAFFIDHLKIAQRVVLIGSDSPSLPRTIVERAFDQLRSHDCVIGPATDGGYYLIGFRRWVDGLFANIDWSSPHVLGQTVRNLTAKECSLQLVSPWYDVDTLEDLQRRIEAQETAITSRNAEAGQVSARNATR